MASLNLGITFLPEVIAVQDVVEEKLWRIRAAWQRSSVSMNDFNETRLRSAKIQRFIEFLRDELVAQ